MTHRRSAPHLRLPTRASVLALFRHQFRRTRHVWGSSLVAALASPILFLFAIGAGLGSQIDDAELATLGTGSYLEYIGPGILIVTAMQLAANESMWNTMGLLKWQGVYKAVLATPITSAELGVGHVLWIGFRSLVAALGFLVVLAVAGALGSWMAALIAVVATLVAWAHAGPIVAFTVGLDREDAYALLSRMVIFPLFLFSGAFFPVDDMPAFVAAFAKATPSWHGVVASRHFASGDVGTDTAGHLVYLLVWSLFGFYLVQRQFRKHLEV